MLYDCSECGDAYAADSGTVTLCPNCQAENTATFRRPIGAPRSKRMGAWAAGIAAAFVVLVVAGAGWTSFDSDGDGLSSYEEMQTGTRPFHGDSDADGISDGWEVDHGLDPLAADTDGDGASDLAELQGAVDPQKGLCNALDLVTECGDSAAVASAEDAPEPARSGTAGKTATGLYALAALLVAGVVGRMVRMFTLRS